MTCSAAAVSARPVARCLLQHMVFQRLRSCAAPASDLPPAVQLALYLSAGVAAGVAQWLRPIS